MRTTLNDATVSKTRECPDCHAPLVIHTGYVTWCDQCGWNVNPAEEDRQPQGIFDRIYSKLGERQSRALFEKLAAESGRQQRLSVSKILGFALAALVHGLTLCTLIAGIALIVTGWPRFFPLVGGGLLLLLTYVLRPRFGKAPADAVPRDQLPTLSRLTDSIADALHAKRIDTFAIAPIFSAAFGRYGWQRKSALILGLPLTTILNDEELTALIAHELAHSVNGDSTRGLLVGSALNALAEWYTLLHPGRIWVSEAGLIGLAMIPWNLLAFGLAQIVRLLNYAMAHLFWRSSQRAEYRADQLAASVSGTDAMLSMLGKLHLGRIFSSAWQEAALNPHSEEDFFDRFRRRIAEAPEREQERLRRLQHLETARLDITHPPTAYRIQLLQQMPRDATDIPFSATDFEQLHAELDTFKRKVEKKLADEYRARISY